MGFMKPKAPKADTSAQASIEEAKKKAEADMKKRRSLLFGTMGGEAGAMVDNGRNTLLGN